jgi:hypothetical protein
MGDQRYDKHCRRGGVQTQSSKLKTPSCYPQQLSHSRSGSVVARGFNVPLYLPRRRRIIEAFLQQPGYLYGSADGILARRWPARSAALKRCSRRCACAFAIWPMGCYRSRSPERCRSWRSPPLGVWLSSDPSLEIGVVAIMTLFPTLVNVYRGLIARPMRSTAWVLRSPPTDIFLLRPPRAALPVQCVEDLPTLAYWRWWPSSRGAQNALGSYQEPGRHSSCARPGQHSGRRSDRHCLYLLMSPSSGR